MNYWIHFWTLQNYTPWLARCSSENPNTTARLFSTDSSQH